MLRMHRYQILFKLCGITFFRKIYFIDSFIFFFSIPIKENNEEISKGLLISKGVVASDEMTTGILYFFINSMFCIILPNIRFGCFA